MMLSVGRFLLFGLISGRATVNLRAMKTRFILINRCIITC